MTENYSAIFSAFQKHIEEEEVRKENIREIVKEIEHAYRELLSHLQAVHRPKGMSEIPSICQSTRDKFTSVQNLYASLKDKVPADEFYRYNDMWRFVTQRLICCAAFVVFLESGSLIGREEVGEFLGISSDPSDNFHMVLEDFLFGILLLADELVRLSLNCATHGDYARPVQIAEFVSEMNLGFRLLNLKNDGLRKRFDGLKYNLKKVEEVVYDLSIRGLKPASEETMT